MKKYLPIIFVFILLALGAYFILYEPTTIQKSPKEQRVSLGSFTKEKSCARLPSFLYKNGIRRPIIDLSQQQHTGVAFIDAKSKKVLYNKLWGRYDALGTYTIDDRGNIYLTPNPFISITPATFNLQKAIYKLDNSGKLERWMVLDDIAPNARNPYGLISIVFDCDDKTLYVSSLDKSDYKSAKGRIYHIDPKKKEIIDKVSGFDALTIALLKNQNGKYLLAGNARDNGVYASKFLNNKIQKDFIKLFDIPNPELRVRKIRVIGKNRLYLEAIKFNYSLIAQTTKKQRIHYIAIYNPQTNSWSVQEQK